MKPVYKAYQTPTDQWRISRTENDITVDLCGAINQTVAIEQSIILNQKPYRANEPKS